MKRISLIIIISLSFGLSACELFRRSGDSGYGYQETMKSQPAKEYYQQKRIHKAQMAREELGYNKSGSLSQGQAYRVGQRLALKRLEDSLLTRAEKKQYYRYKPFLESDSARIKFLRLPTITARERFAIMNGIDQPDSDLPEDMAEIIEENDISLGMNKKLVRQSWGTPDVVEVAGNPMYENERWKYNSYVSSVDGYEKQQRVVYFESGRVVGWETAK